MTLHNLGLILKHYYKVVIIVPVICAILAAGSMVFVRSMGLIGYTATSKLTVTDPTGLVGTSSLANLINVFAQDEVERAKADGIDAKASSDANSQSVEFSAKAKTPEEAVNSANSLAEQTKNAAQKALTEQGHAFMQAVSEIETSPLVDSGKAYVASGISATDRAAALRSCSYTISKASSSSGSSGISDITKYGIVGFVGGLFIVVCVLAALDSIRRPIKGRDDIREITDIPVLSDGESRKSAERLWANLYFVLDDPDQLESVCILPVSGDSKHDISEMLRIAIKSSDKSENATSGDDGVIESKFDLVDVLECDSLQKNMTGAKVANKANATILVVSLWTDKAVDVVNVLDELHLAKAKVSGIVLV